MNLADQFRFSVDNLRRRKGRTILTVIGVVVGVCAIVVMISLGIAVNRATDAMLQNWGDLSKIQVMREGAQKGTPDLDDKMLAQFRAMPAVEAATPLVQPRGVSGQVVGGRNGRYISDWVPLLGVQPDAMEPMGYSLIAGDYGISASLGKEKIPVLIGIQVPFAFRDSKKSATSPNATKYPRYDDSYTKIVNLPQYDANGALLNPEEFFFDVMAAPLTYRMEIGYDATTEETKYKEYKLVPVGMVSAGMDDYTVNTGILMSLENLKKLESDHRKAAGAGAGGGPSMSGSTGYGGRSGGVAVGGYDTVYVKVDSVDNVEAVESAIKETGYQIYSMSQTRKQMQGQVAQTQMMLGGLAAVSLFVAALNIMNTMTMAITERTREIGVMKVLGCRLGNIRRMFLIESGAIGFLGGLMGCAVSFLLSGLLNNLPAILGALGLQSHVDLSGFFGLSGLSEMMPGMKLSVIPLWLIATALVFAAGVGLLSGIAPANRAVRISSLEALRHE
jgi:ABC-type antimicrobial peptide transport system permease subunit